MVVIGVSGHGLGAEIYNPDYLGMQGTLDVFADAYTVRGQNVVTYAFTDNLQSYETPGGVPLAYGFLSLLATLETINRDWISTFDNPTRVVVVAHSHGTVWAHIALHVLEQRGEPIPVDFLIDIDAVSTGWESDLGTFFIGDNWATEIINYSTAQGLTWPFPIWDAEDAFAIPGVAEAQDIEDVVPFSVRANLEVWSSDATGISDIDPNHRSDGSIPAGYRFFVSASNHETTDNPSSDAVSWALREIGSGI